MKMLIRLVEIQFKELIRDPSVFLWGIGFPVLMALGLGLAFSHNGEILRPVAIVSHNVEFLKNTKQVEPLIIQGQKIERFELSQMSSPFGKNKILIHQTNEKMAELLIKRGIVLVVIKDGPLYYFDPRNADAQLTYIISKAIFERKIESLKDAMMIPLEVPGTRYVDFLLPGLIAMGIMMSCLWGICYGLVEKRSKKLLRRLVATPMRKSHYLLSMMIVRVIFGLFETGILVYFGHLFFNFKVAGSWGTVILLFIASHWAFSGLSIVIASRTSNTEIGAGILNAVSTPMMVLSGIFFSYHYFPESAQAIIRFLPLTLVADNFRSVMLEGATLGMIQVPFLGLIFFGIICFLLGLKIFKWY